jgi:citrate synthase
MSSSPLHTRIWMEEPEPDNAFAARAAYCHGYDVYREMLGRASWADMIYLLLRGEAPSKWQARMLETLAVALANPGPRDPSVQAAMCGGVGGSTAAACLTAALSVGAGQSGGAREVFLAMRGWAACGDRLDDWLQACEPPPIHEPTVPEDGGWPTPEHPPGFDPNGVTIAGTTRQTLKVLCEGGATAPRTQWLQAHHEALANVTGLPLAMTGLAAAALTDLGFNPAQGEMLYLLLRLPGAAAHALEQTEIGFKRFPFPQVELLDDPHSDAQLPSEAHP